ncbi:MAG: universal stress protein [Bryobacteraceae bacterium]|jgi:nucleotide-binding universal stress UspA family protein
MPQIKKILFPVDFSESCLGAGRYVEAFAGQFEAEIMLLHVITRGEHTFPQELLPGRKAKLDAFLANELKYFTTDRICTIADDDIDPSQVIVEVAQSWCPDIVMLPTHGLGFFRRHLLGSVTAKALHDLRCPVWTSVHAESAPALEDIHCRKILCSVDLSVCSRNVLQWAAWLAKQYRADLGIVHATAAIDASVASLNIEEEFNRQVSTHAKKRIDALQAEAGTTAEVFINPGRPETIVARTAAEFNADLVVIGRHSGEGIAENVFHSAYAILREAPCPVISV